jgi:Zn-dependent protease
MSKSDTPNQSPIQEYKSWHNFNLKAFFHTNYPETDKIFTALGDHDLSEAKKNKNYDPVEYSRKIIREYTPWENKVKTEYIEIGPPQIDDSSLKSNAELESISVINAANSKKQAKKGLVGVIIMSVVAVLLKFKVLFLFLFSKLAYLFHFLSVIFKFKALMITAGSMLLAIVAYATVFPMELAIGFVFLIFMHEMGHAMMISMRGIQAGLPIFIPFFGAFIALKEMPMDAATEAQVALGGPILGSLTAFLMYVIFLNSSYEPFLYLAYLGFIINLFNLIPVSPLDGGRIVSAISTKMWIPGFILLIAATFIIQSPVLILIIFFAVLNLIQQLKRDPAEKAKYYSVPLLLRAGYALSYFALIIFLGYASFETFYMLENFYPLK